MEFDPQALSELADPYPIFTDLRENHPVHYSAWGSNSIHGLLRDGSPALAPARPRRTDPNVGRSRMNSRSWRTRSGP